jgi:hypothetical protein
MDPFSLLMAASAGTMAAGGVVKVIQDIIKWRKQSKEAKKRNAKGQVSPIVFEDDTLKQVDNMPPKERELVNSVIGMMQADPESFLDSIEDVDFSKLENIAQQPLPTGEQLGFPEAQNAIPQLMQDTDFGGIEQQARQGFQQQTIPALAERFAGLGGLNSTAFRGELGKAGSNLEGQLAGLRSEYGLKRAGTLGSLQQKQQALDVGRAQAIGSLGLAQQGQQFGQQQSLANLGLANNQQQLSQQQQRNNLLMGLLGAGQYGTTGVQQNPGFADTAMGVGAAGLGLGAQNYMQQQNTDKLLAQLKLLNA